MSRSQNEIRSSNELPDWFDISKYDIANTLNYADWYRNLFVREQLLRIVVNSAYKRCVNDKNNLLVQEINADLISLRKYPIYKKLPNERSLYLLNKSIPLTPEIGVQQMRLGDIYWSEKFLDESKVNYARKFIARIHDSESAYDSSIDMAQEMTWETDPLEDVLNDGLIKINLDVPEKLLIEEFKLLLKKLNAGKSTIQKVEDDKWIKYGVLPYIDLKIWELESGNLITNKVLANAIFGNDSNLDGETIRLTTEIHVSKAISNENLQLLVALSSTPRSGFTVR